MTEHLNPENLLDYTKGIAAPATLLAWDDHLAECEHCRSRLMPGSSSVATMPHWAENLPESDDDPHLTYEQLVARVEHRVDPQERFALESHLKQCPSCRQELANLAQFQVQLREDPPARAASRSWVFAAVAAAAAVVVFGLWTWREQSGPSQLSLPSAWSAQDRSVVEQALSSGALPISTLPADLTNKTGTLLGDSTPNLFAPTSPLGTIVESGRPELRWQELAGAVSYQVEIYSGDFQLVTRSPPLTAAAWTPAQPLDRGQLYHWQIIATTKQSAKITVPSPPAPDAVFRVLDQSTEDRIARARADVPMGHLLAATLLAQAGMRPDALRELDLLPPALRQAPQIQNLK